MKKYSTTHQTIIGVDLGEKKHAIYVLGNDGKILKEFDIRTEREELQRFAREHPKARVVMEVGTHSPCLDQPAFLRGGPGGHRGQRPQAARHPWQRAQV